MSRSKRFIGAVMADSQRRSADELDGDLEGDDANHALQSGPFTGHGDRERMIHGMREVTEAPEAHRRRAELIERAVSDNNMDRDLAEYIYDVAHDENVEPAFAFELVFAGLAVCEPDPTASDAEETLVAGPPEWVETPPLPAADAQRERRLRASFRRFRHLLESNDPIAAASAYLEYPDVDSCGY